jgi:hypothetical protein
MKAPTKTAPNRTIAITMLVLITLHAVFALNHVVDWNLPPWVRTIDEGLGEQRAILMILEGMAAGVLFVDLITRFDEINKRVKPFHVLGVAIGVIGLLAQIFVFFLDSALSLA